jgi:hypothetical protein
MFFGQRKWIKISHLLAHPLEAYWICHRAASRCFYLRQWLPRNCLTFGCYVISGYFWLIMKYTLNFCVCYDCWSTCIQRETSVLPPTFPSILSPTWPGWRTPYIFSRTWRFPSERTLEHCIFCFSLFQCALVNIVTVHLWKLWFIVRPLLRSQYVHIRIILKCHRSVMAKKTCLLVRHPKFQSVHTI